MWDKEAFNYSGGFLTYNRAFVARFKYSKDWGTFKTFLIKNFTPAEYFDRLGSGDSPLGILGSKGYVPTHVKKYLVAHGYEPTVAGMKAWSQDSVARTNNAKV